MAARGVRFLAVSKDGRWIAGDAKTYENVFAFEDDYIVGGVDFSPDSTLLVTTSENRTAAASTVWDVAAHKKENVRETAFLGASLSGSLGYDLGKYWRLGGQFTRSST